MSENTQEIIKSLNNKELINLDRDRQLSKQQRRNVQIANGRIKLGHDGYQLPKK